MYASAVIYFVLQIPIYGNPNSLGAVMGVIAVPLLFWGVLISEGVTERRRAIFAFTVGSGLLFFSQARAGIFARSRHMFSGVCRLATLPFAGSGRIGEL